MSQQWLILTRPRSDRHEEGAQLPCSARPGGDEVDPFCGALLIFVSRRHNAVKVLYWHRNDFVVVHKVIEGREKFIWPRLLQEEVVTLTTEQLEWLLEGYDIWRQPHQMLRFSRAA